MGLDAYASCRVAQGDTTPSHRTSREVRDESREVTKRRLGHACLLRLYYDEEHTVIAGGE